MTKLREALRPETKEEIIAKLRSKWVGEVSSTRVHAWAEAIDYFMAQPSSPIEVNYRDGTTEYYPDFYASYANHCAIEKKVPLTFHSWKREQKK